MQVLDLCIYRDYSFDLVSCREVQLKEDCDIFPSHAGEQTLEDAQQRQEERQGSLYRWPFPTIPDGQ
jgi:hypothetical protein